MKKALIRWRNRGIFLVIVALGVLSFFWYINSYDPYCFEHLTIVQDFGESREFVGTYGTIDGMLVAARSDTHVLYVDPVTTAIAVLDTRNGFVWHSRPEGTSRDTRANPFERGIMSSNLGFRYFCARRRIFSRWTYADSVANEQAHIYAIPNGVRITYLVGDTSIGILAIPPYLPIERFQERVMAYIEDEDDIRFMNRFWMPSSEREGFMFLLMGITSSIINTNRMIEMFYNIGYTMEELLFDNAVAGVEADFSLDLFTITIEYVLEGDTLIANIPLHQFETAEGTLIERIELMRFFGAGGIEDEGFILVPSGSGGIINFNNGRFREESFSGRLYGDDTHLDVQRTQLFHPVRLPVFGIAHESANAAMVAHVVNGSGLAVVNADVAGRTNSYNYAWFSFMLRGSVILDMAIMRGPTTEMTITQDNAYEGDITVKFHFLYGEDAGLGGMARAYQQFLVDTNVLTPIQTAGDRSFYLDIIGAADVSRRFFGTPYWTTEIMTSADEAEHMINILAANNINTVQMQLHGWFNRGLNHDVANRVNLINSVANQRELQALNDRLAQAGGGLHPVVNFQLAPFFSRRLNRTFEVARDPAGLLGVMTPMNRERLSIRFARFSNDFHAIVSPVTLPFHIDDFIPQYIRRTGLNTLALSDLGCVLSESMYRRNSVDREHARLITHEQLGRLYENFPNIVVFGGNDYSLQFASHVVGVPTEADMFYIINYSVPFHQMVLHGFIEFAGSPVNLTEHVNVNRSLLNSMTTGASPRYTFTGQPSRYLAFSAHERFYSTHYINWMEYAIRHYHTFNDVHANLRNQRIVDFEILTRGGRFDTVGNAHVTVTTFSDGTRIYVNNTNARFEYNGITIEPMWFYVTSNGL